MDDLKPLHSSKLSKGNWAKSFYVCSSNEIIRLKTPFCSGSNPSVRFFIKTPSLLLGWLSLINSGCLSAPLYHSAWLALIAPPFKGGTCDMAKGAFGEARGVKFSLWHIQQHPRVCISEVCVFADLSQRAGQPRVSPLGMWLPRTGDLKFLGPFRLPSMSSISH